ncbi:unnamed protein product [Nippostrongylus brasiliensis]|uniref:DDE-1 domain-containing protein n=1 Tax=Nippostrongylus brasiliensis TaxID=27835 RepID=A0A0N4YAM4_NIPBR|nr:unnamed protein product [Nippostrongylus brasiliensis]
MLSWASQHFENTTRIYQQDSAPAHSAEVVQKWCADNFSDFILAKKGPPNSSDIIPMDYSVQSILKSKAYATSHTSNDSLKEALKKAWEEIDEDVLRAAVEAFPERLRACNRAKRGHFQI